MWSLMGLGNPGPRYCLSRHNVGFRLIARLCEVFEITLSDRTALAEWGERIWCGRRLVLARPLTYMNLSGSGVRSMMSETGATEENLVIIHDDIDLALGRLRFKRGGGDGGHRGISSILKTLGHDRFLRLKIGIGRPLPGVEPSEHVLAPFEDEELSVIEGALEIAIDAVKVLMIEGVEVAMNRYHSQAL